MRNAITTALTLGLLAASASGAWWETWVRETTSEPLVAAYEAVRLAPDRVPIEDPTARGGAGGGVIALAPGESLPFTAELPRSAYSVWVIARADAQTYTLDAQPTAREFDLPGGKVTLNTPRQPVYVRLEVTGPDGTARSWYMPVAYRDDFRVVAKLYLPVHQSGTCAFSVGIDARSARGLLIDRIELRDVFGYCARRSFKRERGLMSDVELAARRAKAFDRNRAIVIGRGNLRTQYRAPTDNPSATERRARWDGIWSWLPDLNVMESDPTYAKWHNVIGRDSKGVVAELAELYANSGDRGIGMDGAVLLCALAEKYPCLDYYFSESGQHSQITKPIPLSWDGRFGKSVYFGWAGGDLIRIAEAYDQLFEVIKDNQELADYVGTKIPWVRTPQDVVELLDTGLMQHGIDAVNRRIITSAEARARCLKVLGLDLARHVPDAPIFRRARELTEDPTDHTLSYNSRGDVHYIGSTLYVGQGQPKDYLCLAGGFPLQVGDGGDGGRGRVADAPEYPSRVYEGFGAVLLEAGQGQPNPLLKHGLGIFTGIGRGHSHQDTLNIEMFAHGCRLAPDLGGRKEGDYFSTPNMRLNRMHNLVWVDGVDFHNTSPGSTTSGTGWTDTFSPQPGCQYTRNAARATSHPQVGLYQRATAMIEGEVTDTKADMYVFDVFRVRGGREHVYCFHGAYSDTLQANVPLKPAGDDEVVRRILEDRLDKQPLEGHAVDPLVVTWPLRAAQQKRYQAGHETAPVGLTLSLFGHGGERVLVGGAQSQRYPVDMPYLHVYSAGDDGRASVYPAIMEPHAGGRFIAETAALAVTPADADVGRGVALRVVTKQGRTDTLYSSLKPEVRSLVAGGVTVQGEFGFLSEDDRGLVQAHLVGGTELTRGDLSIRCERAAWTAVIDRVDYDTRTLSLDATLPAGVLDGAVALIGNARHRDSWTFERVDGRRAVVQKRITYYQSVVETVEDGSGLVVTEREPEVHGCDTAYTQGTRLANEADTQVWRVAYMPRERWMYLGWPDTDLAYPRVLHMEDVPDADGDGRRTLKLMGIGNDKEPADKAVLTLEVTRTDPTRFTFYFAMPEHPDYQTGGWQFANRRLVNEDGSKTWWATYPGTVVAWQLEDDADVSLDDFPDADGDGKRKVRAYAFGAGDALGVKTFVHVRRAADGGYEVRGNVSCSITLPGRTPVRFTEPELARGPCRL